MSTSTCPYCRQVLFNGKAVAYRCDNCNTVWCANGMCPGSSGRVQHSRTANAQCLTCQRAGGIRKV